jgi:pimeloyl-ACP methyl ester carboxylesterase
MRARDPDHEGFVERDGVRLYWEEFGAGDLTLVLLPCWSIVHSRIWKAQVPYLARYFRVVTFDGRGCGRSDRPDVAEAYHYSEFAADTVAVLDATGTPDAVLVGLSRGPLWGLKVAAESPERVRGLVCLGASIPLVPKHPERAAQLFGERPDTTEGWAKYNHHYWLEWLPRLRRVLRRTGIHRATLDEAARGLHRVGSRGRTFDPGRHERRARCGQSGRLQRAVLACPRAGARDPR